MEKISNFENKGGRIVWLEFDGAKATYRGNAKRFLIDSHGQVYRTSVNEWKKPPKGFAKALGFL